MTAPRDADGTVGVVEPTAVLAMYAFDDWRDAWAALYRRAATGVAGAPADLVWHVDPHDSWTDPSVVLGMACGWPLVTALRDSVRVVGTFAYDVPGAEGHRYRSRIIARRGVDGSAPSLDSLRGATAAINSPDSLSGNVSLCAAFGLASSVWPAETVWTGAHVASVAAVQAGDADVAAIDGVTWAHLQRDEPAAVDGLVVVGVGPLVPCLPVIAAPTTTDAQLGAWRAGFATAVSSAASDPLRAELDTLMITGFAPLDLADYRRDLARLPDFPIDP